MSTRKPKNQHCSKTLGETVEMRRNCTDRSNHKLDSSRCGAHKQHTQEHPITAVHTFKNVVLMIEEEQEELVKLHELNTQQKYKVIDQIERNIYSEINRFETQIKDCSIEAVDKLRDELERLNNGWSINRKDRGIQGSDSTEKFVPMLHTILAERVAVIYSQCDMKCAKDVMKITYQAIFGQQACAKLEREFEKNPDKKAIEPNTRKYDKKSKGANKISPVQNQRQESVLLEQKFRKMQCSENKGANKISPVQNQRQESVLLEQKFRKMQCSENKGTCSQGHSLPAVLQSDGCFASVQSSQEQMQSIISVEASKQMLYDVFGNVIAMLEENEERELSQSEKHLNMPKSDINTPDQTDKTFYNIRRILQCRLDLFEIHMRACPAEVLGEVHEKLMRQTLDWFAVREEMNISDQTDNYKKQISEILSNGRVEITEETVMPGMHEGMDFDKPVELKTKSDVNNISPSSSEVIQAGNKKRSFEEVDETTVSKEKYGAKVNKISITKNNPTQDGFSHYADDDKQAGQLQQKHIQAVNTFMNVLSMIKHKSEMIDEQEIIVIESKIDRIINLFETQIKECSSEIVDELLVELDHQKKNWSEKRKDMGIQGSDLTEKYFTLLKIILAETVADMKCFEDRMKVAYEAIYGKQVCGTLERDFEKNPDMNAKEPATRRGDKRSSGENRILRIQKQKQDEKQLRNIQQNGKEETEKFMCNSRDEVEIETRSDNRRDISSTGQINSKNKAKTHSKHAGNCKNYTYVKFGHTGAKNKDNKKWKRRSDKARKQMMYDIFGNVIAMLEENEERELSQSGIHINMPKSDIYTPDQTHKTLDNIRRIVECRLDLFEIYTKACPAEVLGEVCEELMRLTLYWFAVREESHITEIHQTDYYIIQLYETLSKGKMENTVKIVKPRKQAICCDKHEDPKTKSDDEKTRQESKGTKNRRHDKMKMKTKLTETKKDQGSVFEEKPREEGFFNPYAHGQGQQQLQLQRSYEASKQMVYGVFGNVITAIEEYEKRELAQHGIHTDIQKSDIYIPDQRHKTDDDIKSNVECQLLLFETQSKACPPEAFADVRAELRRQTLRWSAVREENGITEMHLTDLYIAKLYEILAKGSTLHRPPDMSGLTKDVMRSGVQQIIFGDRDRAEIDRKFKENAGEKAVGPVTRRSEMIQMIKGGANRIFRACGNKDLLRYLEADVIKIENDDPEDLK